MSTAEAPVPVCWCDGNGAVDCDECDGFGYTQAACGDDLCTGNLCFHDMPMVRCCFCKGTGVLICPAHE